MTYPESREYNKEVEFLIFLYMDVALIYELVFKEFAECQLKYVIIGGIAVNLHGFARATADLDIILLLNDKEIKKLTDSLEKLGFKPRLPVPLSDLADSRKRQQWITEKNMKVFSLFNIQDPLETIDVLIKCPLDFDSVYERRLVIPFQNIQIPVAGIPDLIFLKEWAGRERDLIDIRALKKIQELQDG